MSSTFRLRGFYPLWPDLSKVIRLSERTTILESYNPNNVACWFGLFRVSLAATHGIDFSFSSSGYLDVSVPCVYLLCAMYSHNRNILLLMWVPPFGNLRIIAYVQLPEAYRSLSRPSSAPSAKASTVRPYSLNLINLAVGF